ncbi:MAG: hypothetical protein GY832_21475 [Chloroflexi bacterium]|nr:hypothetical protein [Chloroflexota bacterium]
MAEYENLAPNMGWNAIVPGICLSIYPFKLLESGDSPTVKEWLAQMYLVVDSETITQHHSLLKTKSMGRDLVDPETGEVIWKEPDGSPLRVWSLDKVKG